MPLEFSHPLAFALLLLLPVFVLIDRASLRARSSARQYVTLAIRLIGVVILVVALAGPVVYATTDTLNTVFLLDRSASVTPSEQQAAINWIERAIQAKRSTDRVAVISFAGDAAVEQGLSSTPAPIAPNARLDVNQTNIAAALRLAEGVLPQGGARRVVLLSDGNENLGSAAQETEVLQAAGIQVDVVPLTAPFAPQIALKTLSVPPAIHQGDRFTLSVAISSNVETTGQVRLLIDDRLDQTKTVQLHVGENNLVIGHDPLSPGVHRFEAIVETKADSVTENKIGYATVQVGGPPRILLVEGDPGDARYLSPALKADGLSVEVASPSVLSGDVASLRPYDGIGLLNVPATSIGADGLVALSSYVHDFGGGLVVLGGDRSFGAGAYHNTPLEDALPVSMNVRSRSAHASVALELVIDVSGSMSSGPPGATKIELARQAALGAVQLLTDQDQIGILAFDDQNHWLYHIQYLTNPTAVQAAIGQLEPAGGTAIYPALEAADNDIAARQAKVKHILLMTDGLAPEGDYADLTAKMRSQGVTLSTIAIGTDADQNLLQNLADWGRGRFYAATDPLSLPRFVFEETTQIARAAIVDETFTPTIVDQTPILDGITSVPQLTGYVATTPKPSAVVGLASPEQDPILAQWQYGLGRTVAYTSDASGGWSGAWVSWQSFSQFWGQVFKGVVPAPQSQSLQVQATVTNGQAQITVDAVHSDGSYINNAATTAIIASPTGPTPNATQPRPPSSIPLIQSAPGRYVGTIPASQQGNYLIQVAQTTAGQSSPATQTGGFTVPYSPEYDDLPVNDSLLRDLVQRTGGAFLTQPAESFTPNLRLADSAQPIWPDLIAVLVPLMLLDVAVRRLRYGPRDLLPVFSWLQIRWQGRTGRAAQIAVRLQGTRRAAPPPAPRPVLRPKPVVARVVPPPASRGIAPSPATPVGAAPSSRLLAAKRRAQPAAGATRR